MQGVDKQVEEELDSLKAIFFGSLHNLRASQPWQGVSAVVEFDLHLTPLDENVQGRVVCVVAFKCVRAGSVQSAGSC